MIQPTALNAVIVGLMVVIFAFFWRMASIALLNRNPDSALGRGMGSLL